MANFLRTNYFFIVSCYVKYRIPQLYVISRHIPKTSFTYTLYIYIYRERDRIRQKSYNNFFPTLSYFKFHVFHNLQVKK